jgi:secreted Zn-dependent insulinase-like peptidase
MRYLRLKNGLEVMLISDPLINRLGAAMTVDVGSCYE